MLKIPTFVIGGILILTGLTGYLIQDPGLTLKLKGPLANDASFILSDGETNHTMDFIPCPESAGENVWWIAHKLNEDHARVASQKNFATENGANDNPLQSFWYASSRGETMEGLLLESERYDNAGSEQSVSIDWTKIDVNSSTLRIIYKNTAGNPGPVTLSSNNWENVDLDPLPESGSSLSFSKSWTAFIPGIIGLLLILLAQAAEMKPNARKHFMHVAVLVGLLGFVMSAKRIGSAVAEMNWLKGEPYGIIHASALKPLSMLLTSGLLLIFVILCIMSFINARKEMAAQAKAEDERKKKVLNKVKNKNQDADSKDNDDKDKPDSASAANRSDQKSEPTKDSDHKKDHSSDKKTPDSPSDSKVVESKANENKAAEGDPDSSPKKEKDESEEPSDNELKDTAEKANESVNSESATANTSENSIDDDSRKNHSESEDSDNEGVAEDKRKTPADDENSDSGSEKERA